MCKKHYYSHWLAEVGEVGVIIFKMDFLILLFFFMETGFSGISMGILDWNLDSLLYLDSGHSF